MCCMFRFILQEKPCLRLKFNSFHYRLILVGNGMFITINDIWHSRANRRLRCISPGLSWYLIHWKWTSPFVIILYNGSIVLWQPSQPIGLLAELVRALARDSECAISPGSNPCRNVTLGAHLQAWVQPSALVVHSEPTDCHVSVLFCQLSAQVWIPAGTLQYIQAFKDMRLV